MSDVAVFDGGAPAPADTPSVTEIPVEQVNLPNPLSSQTPVAEKEPVKVEVAEKTKPTVSDALKKASEQVKAKEAAKEAKPVEKPEVKVEAKPEPKAEEKPARERTPDGKFVAKEQPEQPVQPPVQRQPHHDAPSRFSNDAKAAWEATAEPVKAEVHRAIRELEQGHQKYRASAEAYESVREFDDMAKSNGGNLRASLEKVVQLENAFARNPIEGFQAVADHFGISLRQVAAHIMGQPQDQVQQQNDSTVAALKSEIAQLKQQISGVSESIKSQHENAVLKDVQSFAAEHPRFDELSEDIAFFLKSKRATTLDEAYELAERLNPAPAAAFKPADVVIPPAKTPPPLNPAGQKSLSGAPANGSDPRPRKPSAAPSIRDSIRQAMAAHR